MSKFNQKAKPEMVATHEGGAAYAKSVEMEWTNMLFSSFLSGGFYESESDQLSRFDALTDEMVKKYGAVFAAKAAVFARNELGMRSVSQYLAAKVNVLSFDGKRAFYSKFFRRPDDVAEVFAAIDSLRDKRSHGLVRGASDYISGLSDYSIMKYQMKDKKYNMFDLVNITHAHSAAIDMYKANSLSTPNTWETRISAAKSDEEKAHVWVDLVVSGSLGYLALIRNLRNIIKVCGLTDSGKQFIQNDLCRAIVNKMAIAKSCIFPYQIFIAYKQLKNCGYSDFHVFAALEKAFLAAINNMPPFYDRNAIVLDVSGSMDAAISTNSSVSILEAGACYAAALYLSGSDFEVYKFADKACHCVDINRAMSPFGLIERLCSNDNCGCGTLVTTAFQCMNEHYDRIFLISDCQAMDTDDRTWWLETPTITASEALHNYIETYGETHVYSYDLGNYHSTIDNPDSGRITMLTALNDKVFSLLDYFEENKDVVDFINHLTI